MIGPRFVFVLEGQTRVFEDGYGMQKTSRVAACGHFMDHTMPRSETPAYKAQGAHGDVYIPVEKVKRVIDLHDPEGDSAETGDDCIGAGGVA